MVDVAHSSLTTTDIHEPKGASSASTNTMYVSDGAGSGNWTKLDADNVDSAPGGDGDALVADGSGGVAWKKIGGWAYYNDSTYTSGVPLSVNAGVRTQITVDGLGGGTDESRLPGIWNETTNKVDGAIATLGDCYELRVIFKCQASGTGNDVLIDVDIGGGIGVVVASDLSLLKTGGTTNNMLLAAPIFIGSTFVANGATICVTPSANMTFWDFDILLVKHWAD